MTARPLDSDRDNKKLASLIRKYGRKRVADALTMIVPRSRGRPPRGLLPYFERMHLADWIDTVAEECRQSDSKTPIKDAVHQLYDLIFDAEQQRIPGHFARWQKAIKTKRLLGRRELQAVKAAAEKRAAYPNKLGRE
jgi:hypothetical protein